MTASIKKNLSYQFVWQLLTILTPLITTPYLARVLGAETVGVYAYTNSVTQYFVMFALLGMSSYGVRLISACGGDRAKRSQAFCQAYTAQLISGSLSFAAFMLYLSTNPAGGITVNAIWGLYVLSAVLDVSWLLFGCQEFRIPSIRSIVTNIISLAIIFCCVRRPEDLWIYVATIAGTFLANQMLIWPFVHRYIGFTKPRLSDVIDHLKGSGRLFIPVIAISLYTYLAKILLGSLAGMEQSGFYDYAQKLSTVPLSFITAVGSVMLPKMTAELAEGNREGAESLLSLTLWALFAIALGLAGGIAAISPEFVPIYLGEGFDACIPLMMMLSLVIPIVSLSNVLGRQWLLPSFKDSQYTLSVVGGAAVSIALNMALIPHFGALGACGATLSAELTVLAIQMAFLRKSLPLASYLKAGVPYGIIAFTEFVAIRGLATYVLLPAFGTSILALCLEVVAGAAIFASLSAIYLIATKDERLKAFIGARH